ncbi:PIN domain-containing protein [Gimesia sp.]|uniref:PIN domain-containing protein n=1 Tax=Gimesia sp. TaxID=2024833 RepID=UPI003A9058B7
MIIVIDSNIWISELGLQSSLGSAVRFFIKNNNVEIRLPEVIKLEVESNLRRQLNELISDMNKKHRQLLTLFGSLKELVLPEPDKVEEKVASIFSDIGVEVIHVPFTLEHANVSFHKIIEKLPPSDKSQQFKDGVIWSDCVSFLNDDDVILITSDKAFYKDRNYKNGIADNLLEEVNEKKHKLTLYEDLAMLLEEIKDNDTHLDREKIYSEYLKINSKRLNDMLDTNGFAITEFVEARQKIFATEKPDVLFFEYEFKFQCSNERDDDRIEPSLTITGDGSYSTQEEKVLDLRVFRESLRFKDSNGEEKNVASVFAHAGYMVIGHRNVNHVIRYPLSNE